MVQEIERAILELTRRCVGGLWYMGWKGEGVVIRLAEGRVRTEVLRGAVEIGRMETSSRYGRNE